MKIWTTSFDLSQAFKTLQKTFESNFQKKERAVENFG